MTRALVVALCACDRAPERVDYVPKHDVDEDNVQFVHLSPKLAPRRVLIVGDSEACAFGAYARSSSARFNDVHGQPHDVIDVDCKVSTTV